MASWEEFSRIVAEAKAAKKLDPVGKEDDDINNDNVVDSTDDYLKNKRSAVGAAIAADKKKKSGKDSDEMCEAKVDEKLPEHERATARDKRSGHNLPGSGTRRVRRSEHEDRRGKPKRWWDDDGDGIGYEKGEVKEESEQLDEFLGTGRVVAARSQNTNNLNPGSRYTEVGTVQKIFGRTLPGSFQRGASQSDVARHNRAASPQSQIKKTNQSDDQLVGRQPGGQLTAGITADKKPKPKPTAAPKAAPQGSASDRFVAGATNQARQGRLMGSGMIANAAKGMVAYNDALKKAQQNNSYEPEGEVIDEVNKSDYLDGKLPSDDKMGYGFADNKKRQKDLKKLKRMVKHYDGMKKGDPMYNSYNPEGEQLDEMPYQVYGSPDGKKENKIGKPVKSRRYAQNRADELSDTHKETGGKYHVQHVSEMAVSRAQQRFFGMVRAEQEGKMKGASPEVKSAAKSMTTQQAHDFAATKHAGLPEKKEVKEELSLVDRILAEASEAQLMAAKARKEELAKKQKARLKQAKLSVAANKALKDAQSSGGEETGKDQENKPKLSAAERAAERVASGRIEVAKIQQQTEREKEAARTHRQTRSFERTDASKAAKDAAQKQKAKKQELQDKEEERKAAEKAKKEEKKQHRKDLKQDVKNAWSGDLAQASSENDADTAGAIMSNIGKLGGSVLKTGVALGKYGIRRAKARSQEKRENQKEEFSNWREEFIFEVDDQTVQNEPQEKIIDVSKKKNKIEINPNMSEGCGCEEKEKEVKIKDMRELPTKVNLAKTKARSAGIRNPIVMMTADEVKEDWQSVNRKDKTDGLSQKAVDAYRRENPGSKLQTAVTEKKPTGKRAERRKSFCRRMKGMKKRLTSAETARDPDSRINRALRRWNCH